MPVQILQNLKNLRQDRAERHGHGHGHGHEGASGNCCVTGHNAKTIQKQLCDRALARVTQGGHPAHTIVSQPSAAASATGATTTVVPQKPAGGLSPGTNLDALSNNAKLELLRKLHQVTTPTNAGVTLSRNPNGDIVATLTVSGRDLKTGYVRAANGIQGEGQLSTQNLAAARTITDQITYPGESKPLSYSYKPTRNADGTTTLQVTLGAGVAGFVVESGGKRTLIDPSAVDAPKPTPSVATPPPPAAVRDSAPAPSPSDKPTPAGDGAPGKAPAKTDTAPGGLGAGSSLNLASLFPSLGSNDVHLFPFPRVSAVPKLSPVLSPPEGSAAVVEPRGPLLRLTQTLLTPNVSGSQSSVTLQPKEVSGSLRTNTGLATLGASSQTSGAVPGESAVGQSVSLDETARGRVAASFERFAQQVRYYADKVISNDTVRHAVEQARAQAVKLGAQLGYTTEQINAAFSKGYTSPEQGGVKSSATPERSAEVHDSQVRMKESFERLARKVSYYADRPIPDEVTANDVELARNQARKLGSKLGYTAETIESALTRSHTATGPEAGQGGVKALTAESSVKLQPTEVQNALRDWKAKLRMSSLFKNNPTAAMSLSIGLTEAVTGAMRADYSADAKHSPLPKMLKVLQTSPDDLLTFTTQDGGIGLAIAAEATSSGGDALIVGGATGWMLSKVPSVAAKSLGAVGAAVHGYRMFADGQFQDMNNVQIAGSVASPILMGGTFGAYFGSAGGPVGTAVGAAVGAGAGAVGEGVGIVAGLAAIDQKAKDDLQKRAVRETLRNGLSGALYPENHHMVAARSNEVYSAEVKDALEDWSKIAALNTIMSTFDASDLSYLGFKSPSAEGADSHNWSRMKELTQRPTVFNYAATTLWGSALDQVGEKSQATKQKFEGALKSADDAVKGLYQRSMRVYLNQEGGISASDTFRQTLGSSFGVADIVKAAGGAVKMAQPSKLKQTDEFEEYAKTAAVELAQVENKSERFNSVKARFPGLNGILNDPYRRARLINTLEDHGKGKPGTFRSILDPETVFAAE